MTHDRKRQRSESQAVAIATIGTLAVTVYAGLGMLQILRLNPLAAMPGMTLDQISAELASAEESLGTPGVLVGMSLGPIIAAALLVGALTRKSMTPRVTSALYLIMLVLGAFVYFWASFDPGMALADTFFIRGGDHSPWAIPLYLTSMISFVALVVVAITGAVHQHRTLSFSPTAKPG